MGYLKYVKALYKKPKESLGSLYKERLIQFRKEGTVVRLEKPTRIDRARGLGYKAKKGFFVVRVKVKRGGKMRPRFMSGRKTKQYRRKKVIDKSYNNIAEERAARAHNNCEVIGSYEILRDGNYYWFEVILADRTKVSTYEGYEWVANNPGRVFRGA